MYNWSQEQQGIILSSFFWGYLITQIPGGILSQRYGGKYVFMLGILFSALCSLLTPNVVRFGERHKHTQTWVSFENVENIHSIGRHNKVCVDKLFYLSHILNDNFFISKSNFSSTFVLFYSMFWLVWWKLSAAIKTNDQQQLTAESNGLIILRIFSGLGEGTMYAGLTNLLAAWVPVKERTTLASLAYGGSTVQTTGQNEKWYRYEFTFSIPVEITEQNEEKVEEKKDSEELCECRSNGRSRLIYA